MLLASLLLGSACSSSAYADQVAVPMTPGPRIAIAIANDKVRAPYDVQVIRENGETAPTYALKDRFYVAGNANERYTIHVTNPTANRVEAVVSVDGLDVIDGESADLRKRGYIVPAYGDVRIEGFRTSLDNVATFRFSSVDGSYAGQKGKARNVGVIAVAIFEEQGASAEQQQIIVGDARPVPGTTKPYDYSEDLDAGLGRTRGAGAPSGGRGERVATKSDSVSRRAPAKDSPRHADKKVAEAPAQPTSVAPGMTGGAVAPQSRPAPAPRPPHYDNYSDDSADEEYEAPPAVTTNNPAPTYRQGLGTEYGEQRSSSASYTRFVRSATRPIAIAELRYNDNAGLTALGILVAPLPDAGEIMLRETADPFPGDPHFSRPAR
jgi:hypothetical protein